MTEKGSIMLNINPKIIDTLSTAKHIWFAYSGGLDSHALLHVLSQNKLFKDKLTAVHINHQLSPNSASWGKHCQHVCDQFSIPLEVMRVDVDNENGKSLEAAAREARYSAFQSLVQADDYLVVAHHQDDQAETLLLQLMRGAGPKGLSAMPEITPFSEGYLIRPFLSESRKNIKNYAKLHKLTWIEDESNQDLRFDRNYLRQEIIPQLQQRWPAVSQNIARSAKHFSDQTQLIELCSSDLLLKCAGSQKDTLSVTQLLDLSTVERIVLLRHWIHYQQFPLPSTEYLHEIDRSVLTAAVDATPCVSWNKVEVRRYRDDLYIMAALSVIDESIKLVWDIQKALDLPYSLGKLSLRSLSDLGFFTDKLQQASKVIVRFRRGGEKIKPAGRKETHELKKLFQDAGVPHWERDRIPLLYVDGELAAVVGYWIQEGF